MAAIYRWPYITSRNYAAHNYYNFLIIAPIRTCEKTILKRSSYWFMADFCDKCQNLIQCGYGVWGIYDSVWVLHVFDEDLFLIGIFLVSLMILITRWNLSKSRLTVKEPTFLMAALTRPTLCPSSIAIEMGVLSWYGCVSVANGSPCNIM